MKLPTEVSLHVLGFLDHQTLGRVMVANRRLGGIVNRHRQTLNLPEIPIPPSLSVLVQCLAFLTAVTLLLVPVGLCHAKVDTRSRLRAAGLLPESFHAARVAQRLLETPLILVPCATTCDAQLQCHAECAFQYTLLDERQGRITKRSCSSTGLSATYASLDTHVGWNCSFDYVVNEGAVDSYLAESSRLEWTIVASTSVVLAVIAVWDVVLLLRLNRTVTDVYMAAANSAVRDRIRREHEDLRKDIVRACIVALIPIPPRLPIFLKCLAFLAAVTLVLVPSGFSYAKVVARSRLRAAGLVPEDFHDVQQYRRDRYDSVIAVPCTTTCDSPLQCRAECAFQYTLLDERKGRITKRSCTSTGFSTTNASLAAHVGWNCSFEYVVNEVTVDTDVSMSHVERIIVAAITVLLAVLALADVVLLLRVDRAIGDAYMAAMVDQQRNTLLSKHENFRKHATDATIAAFIFVGFYASAALCSTMFQSFRAVDDWFFFLVLSSFYISVAFLVITLVWLCYQR